MQHNTNITELKKIQQHTTEKKTGEKTTSLYNRKQWKKTYSIEQKRIKQKKTLYIGLEWSRKNLASKQKGHTAE